MAQPCVLVTRPEPQASQWAHALQAKGFDARALPLMAIAGPADHEPVTQLWQHLHEQSLLMFVSPAAVDWFFKLRPSGSEWPSTTAAAAPGPGTSQKLSTLGAAHGLQTEQIFSPPITATQFDSEALWPVLQSTSWQGKHITIVSGGDASEAQGRKWLTERLQEQGAHVKALLCYQRQVAHWSAEQEALALEALHQPGKFVWLVSSSQSLAYLFDELLPNLKHQTSSTPAWHQAQALCTHPRITAYARQKGFGLTLESRPTLDAVVEALRLAASPEAGVDTIK